MAPADFSYAADFVKVPRVLIDLLAIDPVMLTVFLVLLARARYQPGPAFTKHGDMVNLEIGEAVTGRSELAEACGTTERRVRTAIERLETLGILTIRTTRRGTTVTLCRFKDSYPPGSTADQQNDQQPTNRRPTDDQQTSSNKKEKTSKTAKKVKKGERDTPRSLPVLELRELPLEALRTAEGLRVHVQRNAPHRKVSDADLPAWAAELQGIHAAGHTFDVIEKVIAYALGRSEDPYWHGSITSAKALAKKFPTLLEQWECRHARTGGARVNGHGRANIDTADHSIQRDWAAAPGGRS